MIKKKLLISTVLFIMLIQIKSQQISMDFPKFAGKNFDFIIFQGSHHKTIYQGVIPEDGKFILSVPKEYKTYIGMSRWLITGTKEGGGLDMFIPGHDFSISCSESIPNEKNIIYTNNAEDKNLNNLYRYQEKILSRYQSMLLATKSYESSSSNYSIFESEYEKQKRDYITFQKELREKADYASRLLSIINTSRGMGATLSDREDERGKDISEYISQYLDWNLLYTSGYWNSVIDSWVNIHTNVLKDLSRFKLEFEIISTKIKSAELYTEFYSRTSYCLNQLGQNSYLAAIVSSGKTINN